jgi:hypothetical protein
MAGNALGIDVSNFAGQFDWAAQASYFVEQVSKVGLETTDMLWLDNETAGSSPWTPPRARPCSLSRTRAGPG